MKTTTLKSIGIASLACLILFAACNKNEDPLTEEGSVTFSMEEVNKTLKSTINAEQLKNLMHDPEDADKFVISIDNESGTEVKTLEELDVHNFNGQFVSDPISLLIGNYLLKEFLVKDDSGNVIFATPVEGSEKAYLVDDPLAIAFTVSKDQVTQVVPEVLDTEESVPDDFGYNSFSFEVVETFDFLVSVLVFDENIGDWVLTDAIIEVEVAGNIIFQDTLLSQIEKITINDGYANYMVSITKDGYNAIDSTFINAELKAYFNEPLLIKLFEEDEAGDTTGSGEDTTGNEAGTVVDYDGNVYQTVQIGNQVWMAENLAATMYSDGTEIPYISEKSEWEGLTTPAYCWHKEAYTFDGYGALYNWYAVETGKICPDGWHVPTDKEWMELEMTLGLPENETYVSGWRGEDIGSKLAGEAGSFPFEEISNELDFGSSGFSAFPGGYRDAKGNFFSRGCDGRWWTATELRTSSSRFRYLNCALKGIGRKTSNKKHGYSVRCVKD